MCLYYDMCFCVCMYMYVCTLCLYMCIICLCLLCVFGQTSVPQLHVVKSYDQTYQFFHLAYDVNQCSPFCFLLLKLFTWEILTGSVFVIIFGQMSYFLGFVCLQTLNEEQHEKAAENEYNFDCPDAFDLDLIVHTVRRLKEGKSVEIPVYNFATHRVENYKVSIL